MPAKLTPAQRSALETIINHPGRVEAVTRVTDGWKRINGNVEHSLRGLGLIAKSAIGEPVTYTTHGRQHTVDVRWWYVTEAGQAALAG